MKDKFIGVWMLNYYRTVHLDLSHHSFPYGELAKGTLIYTKEGRMSALLMGMDRPQFEIAHPWKGTNEEMKMAFRQYTSYSGNFKILDKGDIKLVVHQVDMSLFPNWLGVDLKRNFEFKKDGKQLLLSTDPILLKNGVKIKNELLWDKIG